MADRERIKLLKQDILNVRRAFEEVESTDSAQLAQCVTHECTRQCALSPEMIFGRVLDDQLQQPSSSQNLFELWELALCALVQTSFFNYQKTRNPHTLVHAHSSQKAMSANPKTYGRGGTSSQFPSNPGAPRVVKTDGKQFHPFGPPSFNYVAQSPHPPPSRGGVSRRFNKRGGGPMMDGGPQGGGFEKTLPRNCVLSSIMRLIAEVAALQQALSVSHQRLEDTQKLVIELKHSHAQAQHDRPQTVDKISSINQLNLEVERLETALSRALKESEQAMREKDKLEEKYRTIRDVQDAQYARDLKTLESKFQVKGEQLEKVATNKREELDLALRQARLRTEEAGRASAHWKQQSEKASRETEEARMRADKLQARLGHLENRGGEASGQIEKLRAELMQAMDAKSKLTIQNKELDVRIDELNNGSKSKVVEIEGQKDLVDKRLGRTEGELAEARREIDVLKARIKELEDMEGNIKRKKAEKAVEVSKTKDVQQKQKRQNVQAERARLTQRAHDRSQAKKEAEEQTRLKEEEEKKHKKEQEKKRRARARAEAARRKAQTEADEEAKQELQATLEKKATEARAERLQLQQERDRIEKENKEKNKKEKEKKEEDKKEKEKTEREKREREKKEREKKEQEDKNKGSKKVRKKGKKKDKAKPTKPAPKKTQSGYGKCIYGPGEWYEGYWEDYERHGEGQYHWADGRCYEGQWSRDKKHGKGRYHWSDGDKYEGDYNDDKMSGFGTYHFGDGTRYEGQWEMDMSHGKGIFFYHDGAKYQGSFNQDRKHGPGIMTHVTGEVFQEQWKFGKCIKSARVH